MNDLAGTDVDVYYNLHKHVFSVRDRKSRLVVAHAKAIDIRDVTFRVSEPGRQRVLRERKKNVHAFVRGTVFDYGNATDRERCEAWDAETVTVRYNPYEGQHFTESTGRAVVGGEYAFLSDKAVIVLNPIYLTADDPAAMVTA